MIRTADLVITYSRLMQQSAEALNPRNVVLQTNIRREWLVKAESRSHLIENEAAGSEEPIKIAFAGGEARREELSLLWPAIVEASRRLGARAEFSFWGGCA